MFYIMNCSKKRRVVIFLFVLVFLLGTTLGIAAEKPEKEEITIGFVPYQLGNPFLVPLKIGAEDAAEEFGVNLKYMAPVKMDAQQQIAMLESLIEMKVDAIVTIVIYPGQLINVINKGIDAGIPVVITNSDEPDSKRIFYCGVDVIEDGKLQAEMLKKEIQKRGWSDRTVKGVLTSCKFGDFTIERMWKGFELGIADTPNIKVINKYETSLDATENFSVVENMFTANPDIDFAYGCCAVDCRSVGEMVKRSGRDNIIAFGSVLLPGTLQLIKEGHIGWATCHNAYEQGYFPVKALYEHIALGKPLPTEFVSIKTYAVTIETVEEAIKTQESYYE